MTRETDEQLIERILRHDQHAMTALVERHKDRAYTLALRILAHEMEAEEALQDAFLRCFKGLASFDKRARFSTWFYRIVYNVCLTRRSKLKNSQEAETTSDLSEIETRAGDLSSDATLLMEECSLSIEAAIRRLPDHLRTIVTLFYTQEMSYEEIVLVTGMPLGTVKTHLFRARTALKKMLAKEFQPEELV